MENETVTDKNIVEICEIAVKMHKQHNYEVEFIASLVQQAMQEYKFFKFMKFWDSTYKESKDEVKELIESWLPSSGKTKPKEIHAEQAEEVLLTQEELVNKVVVLRKEMNNKLVNVLRMSQRQLADKIGTKQANVWQILNKTHLPRRSTLEKYLKALNMPEPDWIDYLCE